MTASRGPFQIRLKQDHKEVHAPLGANYFNFTRLGNDIALQVGWVSVPQAVETLELARTSRQSMDVEVTAHVHQLYYLSPSGFMGLYRRMQQFVEGMQKDGTFPKGSLPETDD